MAVMKNVENSILSLKTQVGLLTNGKPKYKTYSYSSVAVDATDSDMYAVAVQLASLFEEDIAKIDRHDISNLHADS